MLTKSHRTAYKSTVKAGAAFLTFLDVQIGAGNLTVPFSLPSDDPWFIRTDIDELDLADGSTCSLAQYAKKTFFAVSDGLGFTDSQQSALGFTLPDFAYDDSFNDSDEHWAYLTKCWRKEIKRLRLGINF